MKPLVNAASWRAAIEIALWRHGWVWPLVIILIIATTAMYFAALRPSQQSLASLERTLKQQANTAHPASAQVTALQSEQQRLRTLQAVLRQSPQAGELVRNMVMLAEAEQIQLAQSDYQRQFHNNIQVSQVQVMQPVRATYPQLRRYVESVLRNVPNASLDQITARRDNVGQALVEARLKWSLWTQTPATAKATSRQDSTL